MSRDDKEGGKYRELAILALQIAIEAPERFSRFGSTTCVTRSTVQAIRNECDRLGIDWQGAAAAAREADKKAREVAS